MAANPAGYKLQAAYWPIFALQWDANTEPDLAGYKVYYDCDNRVNPLIGTVAQQGVSPVSIGNVTNYIMSGLNSSCSYYAFRITAVNTAGGESGFSSLIIGHMPDADIETISFPDGVGMVYGTGVITSSIGTPAPVGITYGIGPSPSVTTDYEVYANNAGMTLGVGNVSIIASSSTPATGVGTVYGIGTTAGSSSTVVSGSSLGAIYGVGNSSATGIINVALGQGFSFGTGWAESPNATQTTIRVIKNGSGSARVIGGDIDCGDVCQQVLDFDKSVTLQFTRDTTGADLMSWGGVCQHVWRNDTCTITADKTTRTAYEKRGVVTANLTTGYFAQGNVRTGRGTSTVRLWLSAQDAYNAIAAGTAFNPIDLVAPAADTYLAIDKGIDIAISGGWSSFFDGTPGPTVSTTLDAPLVVSKGSLTLTGNTIIGAFAFWQGVARIDDVDYSSLQLAWNDVQAGSASNVIKLLAGSSYTVNMTGTREVELSGGWSNSVKALTADGVPSIIPGPFVVRTAPIIISGGGVTIR